uniref:hypothetical protein n=1 Tax=Flavobacterium sp. TaxID=239 RepID=UPI00404B6D5C
MKRHPINYGRKTIRFFKKVPWKFIFLLGFVFHFISCSVHNQTNTDDYYAIPNKFSAKFYDRLDTIPNCYSNIVITRSLVKELTGNEIIDYSKPIQIDINNDELFLSFKNIFGNQYVMKFQGKLRKKKFIFYTNYETISFPILFITKNVTKYSIFLRNNKEISIENYNASEGMVLLFGAGNSWKSHYNFKLLPNE